MAIISEFVEEAPIVSNPREEDSPDVPKSKEGDGLVAFKSKEEDSPDFPKSKEDDVSKSKEDDSPNVSKLKEEDAPVVPKSKEVDAPIIPKPKEESDNGGKTGRVPNSGHGLDFPTYSWVQTQQEATVTVPVPEGTKSRAVAVEITATDLKVGLKGQPPIVEGKLYRPVKVRDSLWTIEDGPRSISVLLTKQKGTEMWKSLLVGEPEIDMSKGEPQKASLLDLDAETRPVVEKVMFDQRQKAKGLPTSEELERQDMFARLKRDFPQMDFSKFNKPMPRPPF